MIGPGLTLTGVALASKTVVQKAIAVLRSFGTDAHVYLPGIGMLNGLQAGNYIDSAGSQAGVVDQPVGLDLDAMGGLGAELVTPASFSGTGWSATGTLNTDGAVSTAIASGVLVSGKTYEVIATVSGGAVNLYLGSSTFQLGVTGAFTFIGVCSGSLDCMVQNTTVGYKTVSISVREVTGIHASQTLTGSKPILRRGALNLLTYSQDFTNVVWVATGTTAKVGYHPTITGPDGTLSAYQLDFGSSSTDGLKRIYSASAGAYTQVYHVRTISGTKKLRVKTWDGAANTFTSDIQVGTSWQVLVMPTATALVDFQLSNEAAGGAASILIHRAGVFQGTYTAAQIQDLGGIPLTTTAPASTALGPCFWSFDGGNDSLQLGGPLFQMSDDHCVVAGAKPASTTTGKIFYTGVLGAGSALNLSTDQGRVFAAWGDGTTTADIYLTPGSTPVGVSNVVSLRSIGVNKLLRVGGGRVSGASSVVIAPGAVTHSNIGSDPQNYSYFNGAIYPVIAIKGTVSNADLLLLEKLVANLSGVTL